MRSVWRALSWPDFSSHFWMFEICHVCHHFWRTCPPDHNVRSVWRAPPRRSGSPLGRRSGHSGHPSRLRRPASSRALRVPGPEVASERPNSRTQTLPRTLSQNTNRLFVCTFVTSPVKAGQDNRDDRTPSALITPVSATNAIWVLHDRPGVPECSVLMM